MISAARWSPRGDESTNDVVGPIGSADNDGDDRIGCSSDGGGIRTMYKSNGDDYKKTMMNDEFTEKNLP